ncbi:MAG TPA: FAD-binding protein [Chryseosolibacter sp.]
MNKRTFLKTSTALVTGTMLSGFGACAPGKKEHLTNWSGNLQYSTDRIHYPATAEEVQRIVRESSSLRALGSQHSFNTIADSKENLVSSRRLNKIIALDKSAHTVTVEGGIKYGELVQYLHENGYALHNLASLPHISVAGAIATATHGSGVKNGNLATPVSAIEFVNGQGEVVQLSKKDGDVFNGAVVALGALGFVTKVTLDLLPTFSMKQVVYRNLPMSALKDNFAAIMSAGYSVSLFTDWSNANVNEVWVKSLADAGDKNAETEFYGARPAEKNMHPVESQSAESCTPQMGVAGPWFERLPHFKMGFTPSTGRELQSEYFVPLEHGYEAMMAVESLHEKITPHLFISEIRTIDADDLWMSPCYKKPCVTIHTTWKPEWDQVMDLLPQMEAQLAPFNPRPHWGKLFTIAPSILQQRIERLADFKGLVNQHDPKGKFRNEFLQKNIYGVAQV